MDIRAFQYINNYLKERYAVYYEYLNKELMHTDIIASICNKYSSIDICNGVADNELEDLIENYMKNSYSDVWNNYTNVFTFVKNTVLSRNNIFIFKPQTKILNYVIDKIVADFLNDKELEDIEKDRKECEEYVIDKLRNYHNRLYENLSSHIDEVIIYSSLSLKCNKPSYHFLRKIVIEKILNERSVDDILDGACDDEMVALFIKAENDTKGNVANYVKKLVSNLDFPFGIPENEVISHLNKEIFETGKISVSKIFNGEYDGYIVSYGNILKNRNLRKTAQEHVDTVILKNANLSEDEILKYGSEIMEDLINNHRCNLVGISSGRYDELIVKLLNRFIMRKNSVVEKTKPKKIKHKTSKKSIVDILKKLLLIVTMSCVLLGAGTMVKTYSDDIQYNVAYNEILKFDGYDYNFIFSDDNEMVWPTASNTITFYQKVKNSGFNENLYGYLGFYSSYTNVRQDKLHIMDKMFNIAKHSTANSEYYADFYKGLADCSCFLEFAMKCLYDMGVEDIYSDENISALEAYIEADSKYNDRKVMNVISDENVQVIERIMAMYRLKCRELVVNFGDVLQEEDSLLNVNSSRRHI